MVLCANCRSSRDWRNDPVVQNRIRRNLAAPEGSRARCGDCFGEIQNPMFRLHRRCARTAGLCQHCSGAVTAEDLQHDASE